MSMVFRNFAPKMKERMRKTASTVLLLMVAVLLSAQPLSQDPTIKTGKLKNGLTYYLRHNAKEAGLADFYIAQKVGSIQEEPRQRGLAHFLLSMVPSTSQERASSWVLFPGARPLV